MRWCRSDVIALAIALDGGAALPEGLRPRRVRPSKGAGGILQAVISGIVP